MFNFFMLLAKPSFFVATLAVFFLLNLGGSDCFKSAISYNFTFYCDMPETWCVEMMMLEMDQRTTSEPWMYSSFCTNQSSYQIFSETMRGEGDGLYHTEYEVRNFVFHNCTTHVHKSSYNCKYNALFDDCHSDYQRLYEVDGSEHKCQCATSPNYRRIPINTVETFSEVYNLTESSVEAYNWWNAARCNYPYAFMELQVKSPEKFPRNLGSCNWNDEVPNTKFTFVKHRPRVISCIPDERFTNPN